MTDILTGRPATLAPNGMVTSPHSLASAAGVDVLRAGGTAVDAAVATSAALSVLYPHMTGVGGDAFWLIHDARTKAVRYLDGGGVGCFNEDDRPTDRRKLYHHLTFYGFGLCFAATCIATLYHYLLAREAPYAWWDLPVVLGTLGGIGLLIGPVGLLAEKWKRDPVLVGQRHARNRLVQQLLQARMQSGGRHKADFAGLQRCLGRARQDAQSGQHFGSEHAAVFGGGTVDEHRVARARQ